MLTYTKRRNLFGKLSNDSSSANLLVGDSLMETFEKRLAKNYNFLETSRYASTVGDQQFYGLPANFGKIKTITVTIGSTKHFPKEISSREQWDKINENTSITSDIPEWYFIYNGEIGFWPTPSSSNSDAIYLQYHRKFRKLSVADYTTGTIDNIENGESDVSGSGTSWTDKMEGMWIMIDDSASDNTGDGAWYEIDSVETASSLTLVSPYQGQTIDTGSATYTIGQVSNLPEDFQMIPVFEALEAYFTSMKPDTIKQAYYRIKTKELKDDLMAEYGTNTTNPVVSEMDDYEPKNPNLYVEG